MLHPLRTCLNLCTQLLFWLHEDLMAPNNALRTVYPPPPLPSAPGGSGCKPSCFQKHADRISKLLLSLQKSHRDGDLVCSSELLFLSLRLAGASFPAAGKTTVINTTEYQILMWISIDAKRMNPALLCTRSLYSHLHLCGFMFLSTLDLHRFSSSPSLWPGSEPNQWPLQPCHSSLIYLQSPIVSSGSWYSSFDIRMSKQYMLVSNYLLLYTDLFLFHTSKFTLMNEPVLGKVTM